MMLFLIILIVAYIVMELWIPVSGFFDEIWIKRERRKRHKRVIQGYIDDNFNKCDYKSNFKFEPYTKHDFPKMRIKRKSDNVVIYDDHFFPSRMANVPDILETEMISIKRENQLKSILSIN